MSVYFVAGAGTDIGKTYVTTLLVGQLKAEGRDVLALKPVVSGVPAIEDPRFATSDTARLLAAQGVPVTLATVEACSPWRFREPLSPDMAAAAEGRSVSLQATLDWCRDRIAGAHDGAAVLVEGVGGVMSPMTSDGLNLDLVVALGCEVLLVAGTYLGALSHVLTAIETLRAHKVPLRAVILNESADSSVDFAGTLATLQRFAAGATIVTLRRGARAIAIELG